MLTNRGWWLTVVAGTAALLGVLPTARYGPAAPVLGLSVLGWLAVEYLLFQRRWLSAAGRLTVERELLQGGRPATTAWAGSPCTVRLTITLTGDARLPLAVLDDRPPDGVPISGSFTWVGDLRPGEPVTFEYELKPAGPGVLRFDGVQVRAADASGLVYARRFLRQPVEIPVLPSLADDEGHRRADKRFNTLPPPGIHRLRRAGSGSELLDLRDYRPGDPPKTIAWKTSARRDRLITKEYESDVPVRCVLFLDASERVRHGHPGRTPAARLAGVAAAVAQAAAANRDLVGLTVFDDAKADALPPARTSVHTIRLLAKLAEAAGRMPNTADATDAKRMLRRVEPVARELYPELFDRDVNALPAGMYWIPLLDRRWGWLIPLFMISPVLVFRREIAELVAGLAFQIAGKGRVLITMFLLLLVPPVSGGLFWLFFGIRGFFAPHSIRTRKRKTLGLLFAGLDGDGPAAVERYVHDDTAFARRAAEFLLAHHVRDPEATPPAASAAPDAVLADALVRSVMRARDNELYVILADVTDPDPVAEAVRFARVKHHQVMVVVPWPDGLPLHPPPAGPAAPTARRLVRDAAARELHARFDAMRTELTRSGATVVRAADGDPVRAILDRLDRVRGVRSRR